MTQYAVFAQQLKRGADPWMTDEEAALDPEKRTLSNQYKVNAYWLFDDPGEADDLLSALSSHPQCGWAKKQVVGFGAALKPVTVEYNYSYNMCGGTVHVVAVTWARRPRRPVGYYWWGFLGNRGQVRHSHLTKLSTTDLASGRVMSLARLSRLG